MKKSKFSFNKNEIDSFINKEILNEKISELSLGNNNNYNILKNAINSFEKNIFKNKNER